MTEGLTCLCSKPSYGSHFTVSKRQHLYNVSEALSYELSDSTSYHPSLGTGSLCWSLATLDKLPSEGLCIFYPLCLGCCSSDTHGLWQACFFISASDVLPDHPAKNSNPSPDPTIADYTSRLQFSPYHLSSSLTVCVHVCACVYMHLRG